MNTDLFKELNSLMIKKEEIESFLEQLKKTNYLNSIVLNKGINEYYFDGDLIPILIKYFEDKIKSLDNKIADFKLTKIIS